METQTLTYDNSEIVKEMNEVIDQTLSLTSERSMFSADEVSNLLLDLRQVSSKIK